MKVQGSGGGFGPFPSLFDVLVCGLLITPVIDNPFLRNVFFIFYSFFLISLTVAMQQKREYKSFPLFILLGASFISLFAHNDLNIVPDCIINSYFNTAIMFEGFIFVFIGVFLLRAIISYSTNKNFILAMSIFSLISFFSKTVYCGRITFPFAFLVSCVVFFLVKRFYLIAALLTAVSLVAAFCMREWIVLKFTCRPYVWAQLLREIRNHPIVGNGFNNTLYPDNMIWVSKIGDVVYGWLFRYNDFLSIGAYLGVMALLAVIWFTAVSMRQIGVSWYLIPFLTVVIGCFFQTAFFQSDTASVCLVTGAACLIKGEVR